MAITLTESAIKKIETDSHHFLSKINEDLVPVITWVVGDTSVEMFTQQLGLGFMERNKIGHDRLLSNVGDFDIFSYLPEHITEKYRGYCIDVRDGALTFVRA